MNSPNDFMAKLRNETSSVHQQLEQTSLSMSVMAPVVSTEDYTAYLQTMLTIHKGIEANVFPVLATLLPDIDTRRKTQLILNDLQQLGAEPERSDESFTDDNYTSDPAFNLGILYVSEGSTLGGKVIMKNVLSAAKTGINEACHFLDAYGDKTGSRWKEFIAAMDQYQLDADEATRSRIIAGANYGFERTSSLFQKASAAL